MDTKNSSRMNNHLNYLSWALMSVALLFLLLIPLVTNAQGSGETTVPSSINRDLVPDIELTSIEELGFTKGFLFQGAGTAHGHTFNFPITSEVVDGEGVLRIHFSASPMFHELSNLRIDVNGIPRKTVSLHRMTESQWLTIPIGTQDLQGDSLKVGVRPSLVISDNKCFDTRVGTGSHLFIHEDSQLQLKLIDRSESVTSAWALLPKRVAISLPEKLTREQLPALLMLSSVLQNNGKKLEFIRLPELGDIAFSGSIQLEEAISDQYFNTPSKRKQAAKYFEEQGFVSSINNIGLVTLPDSRSIISLREPFDGIAVSLMQQPWLKLALAKKYRVNQNPTFDHTVQKQREILFNEFDFDSSTRYLSSPVEWNVHFNAPKVHFDEELIKLELNVISTPEKDELPTMLYVYLNGMLQHVRQLPDDGQAHGLSIPLNVRDQKAGENHIRIVAQRKGSSFTDECVAEVVGFPIQIDGESRVQLAHTKVLPKSFSDLRGYFANGFTLYLPVSVLNAPDKDLPFIFSLLAKQNFPIAPETIQLYHGDEVLMPAGPFVIYGSAKFSPTRSGVSFDRGHIQVVDYHGEQLLSVSSLPGVSVAQLATYNDAHGLWIMPGIDNSLPNPLKFELSDDDVAFADSDGVMLTVNSQLRDVSKVEYPSYVSWFDLFDRYRFWLVAFGWLMLIGILTYLYRQSKRHAGNV